MKNRFYVTSYSYMINFEYIFGMILSNLSQLKQNRGWENIKTPTSFVVEREVEEVIEKRWFSKEKTVTQTKRYLLFFIFENELDEKDLMFWRGFVLGNWKNY